MKEWGVAIGLLVVVFLVVAAISHQRRRPLVRMNPEAKARVVWALGEMNAAGDAESCLMPHFVTPHSVQEQLNALVNEGRSVHEASEIASLESPVDTSRIAFGIGSYAKGQRPAAWRRQLLGFEVSISPKCLRALEGRKLVLDEEGHLVAEPALPPELIAELFGG